MTAAPDEDESDEWKYSVEDVGRDDDEGRDDGTGEGDGENGGDRGEEGGGSVFGPRPDEGDEIVPGDPDLENALFVVLGVAMTFVLLLDLVGAI